MMKVKNFWVHGVPYLATAALVGVLASTRTALAGNSVGGTPEAPTSFNSVVLAGAISAPFAALKAQQISRSSIDQLVPVIKSPRFDSIRFLQAIGLSAEDIRATTHEEVQRTAFWLARNTSALEPAVFYLEGRNKGPLVAPIDEEQFYEALAHGRDQIQSAKRDLVAKSISSELTGPQLLQLRDEIQLFAISYGRVLPSSDSRLLTHASRVAAAGVNSNYRRLWAKVHGYADLLTQQSYIAPEKISLFNQISLINSGAPHPVAQKAPTLFNPSINHSAASRSIREKAIQEATLRMNIDPTHLLGKPKSATWGERMSGIRSRLHVRLFLAADGLRLAKERISRAFSMLPSLTDLMYRRFRNLNQRIARHEANHLVTDHASTIPSHYFRVPEKSASSQTKHFVVGRVSAMPASARIALSGLATLGFHAFQNLMGHHQVAEGTQSGLLSGADVSGNFGLYLLVVVGLTWMALDGLPSLLKFVRRGPASGLAAPARGGNEARAHRLASKSEQSR